MGKKGKSNKCVARQNMDHVLRFTAKKTRERYNPSHCCVKCGADISNSVHHFYCDDCHRLLDMSRPIGGVID